MFSRGLFLRPSECNQCNSWQVILYFQHGRKILSNQVEHGKCYLAEFNVRNFDTFLKVAINTHTLIHLLHPKKDLANVSTIDVCRTVATSGM